MVNGKRYAGAAVVSPEQKLWTAALPHGALAQKAELIALTKVLQMAKGKTANIYMDSKYAFPILHIHGAIYKERDLLTAEGKGIKTEEKYWFSSRLFGTQKRWLLCISRDTKRGLI